MSSSPTVSRIIRTRSLWPGQSANGAATVTVTEQLQSTSTTNPYNNGRPTKLSNMLPGLIIAVFCFASVCIAAGLLRARLRRRRRVLGGDSRSVPSSASNSSNGGLKKKKTRPTKPQLWDVEVKDVNWAIDLEALHPVAAELHKHSWLDSKTVELSNKDQKSWFVPSLSRSHKPQQPPTTHQAQLTFMVAMPAPEYRRGVPSREIALGTRLVPYQDEDSDDDDDEAALPKLLSNHTASSGF